MLTLLSLCLCESCNNNRAWLRILEQERRRRQAVPEEEYPLSEKTPLFAKPYKVMGVGCRLEGQEEGDLGWDRRAVSSAWAVADLTPIHANTASSHLLH